VHVEHDGFDNDDIMALDCCLLHCCNAPECIDVREDGALFCEDHIDDNDDDHDEDEHDGHDDDDDDHDDHDEDEHDDAEGDNSDGDGDSGSGIVVDVGAGGDDSYNDNR
jgi:hypothetical protein